MTTLPSVPVEFQRPANFLGIAGGSRVDGLLAAASDETAADRTRIEVKKRGVNFMSGYF